jgi:hypothetical protein
MPVTRSKNRTLKEYEGSTAARRQAEARLAQKLAGNRAIADQFKLPQPQPRAGNGQFARKP